MFYLEVDNVPREQVELAWRFWRRAKGEQESGGRLAWRLDLVGLDHLGDFEEDRANNVE